MRTYAGAVLPLALAACHSVFGVGLDPTAPLSEPRVRLHVDTLAPGTRLEAFPLLVVLDDTRAPRALLQPEAADLRFYDDDGTLLAHEIEQVGAPGGEPLLAWVRVPELTSTTEIAVDFGRPEAPALVPSSVFWSDRYGAVWHFARDRPYLDATGQAHDLAPRGTTAAAGAVGDGRAFDGTDDSLEVSAPDAFKRPQMTVTGWMYLASPLSASSYRALVAHTIGDTSMNDLYLGTLDTIPVAEAYASTPIAAAATESPGADRWFHLALAIEELGLRLYVDGAPAGQIASNGPFQYQPGRMILGADCNTCGNTPPLDDNLDGRIDEVRVELVARPADWIAADVASMNDGLLRYEIVDTTP